MERFLTSNSPSSRAPYCDGIGPDQIRTTTTVGEPRVCAVMRGVIAAQLSLIHPICPSILLAMVSPTALMVSTSPSSRFDTA